MNKFFKQFSKVRLLSLVIFSVLIILGTIIFKKKYKSGKCVECKDKDGKKIEIYK